MGNVMGSGFDDSVLTDEWYETSLSMSRAKTLKARMQEDKSSICDANILYSVGIDPEPVKAALEKLPNVQAYITSVENSDDTVETNLSASESERLYEGVAPQKNITNMADVATNMTSLGSKIGTLLGQNILGDIATYNSDLDDLKHNTRLRMLQQTADQINKDHKPASNETRNTTRVNMLYGSDFYYMYNQANPMKTTVNKWTQTETYYTVGQMDKDGYADVTTHKRDYYYIDYDSIIPSNADSVNWFWIAKKGDMKEGELQECIENTGTPLPYNKDQLRNSDGTKMI